MAQALQSSVLQRRNNYRPHHCSHRMQNESVCTDITIEHMTSVNMHELSVIQLSDSKESTLKLEHRRVTSSTREEVLEDPVGEELQEQFEASPEMSHKLCYSPDSMESMPRIQTCPQQYESLQMLKPRPLDNDCERFI
jgi:hypothetical protein